MVNIQAEREDIVIVSDSIYTFDKGYYKFCTLWTVGLISSQDAKTIQKLSSSDSTGSQMKNTLFYGMKLCGFPDINQQKIFWRTAAN